MGAGLCYDTNEPVLKEAFEKHGDIIEGVLYLWCVKRVKE